MKQKNERTIRAKWTFNGAETIEEMIEKLEEKKEHLKELQEEGFELQNQVEDDYAHLTRDEVEE
jgi:predicted transcriptional regulator